MHRGLFLCTLIYIRAASEQDINGILFLHQYLLLFIMVEADAHISTVLPKDGEKAFLYVGRNVNLATPCLIKPATGIRRMGIEITSSARWDGIVNAQESPRPYLLFCNKMIGTLLAFTHQMRSEQRKLQNEVPDSLLLPFLHHVNDAYEMGKKVNWLTFTAEEYISLLSATAKWQLLEQRIYECLNPNEIKPQFDNEVFVTVLNGRPVKMEELRKTISLMVKLVNRKNQWFCVWSVLKHHNLLGNYSHEAFARQMMSSYWFGDVEDYKRFSGDTLREYKRYFSDYDYTQWDNDDFLEQKQLFGMTKWSNSLCQKFQKLCQEMEQAIVGWKYLS